MWNKVGLNITECAHNSCFWPSEQIMCCYSAETALNMLAQLWSSGDDVLIANHNGLRRIMIQPWPRLKVIDNIDYLIKFMKNEINIITCLHVGNKTKDTGALRVSYKESSEDKPNQSKLLLAQKLSVLNKCHFTWSYLLKRSFPTHDAFTADMRPRGMRYTCKSRFIITKLKQPCVTKQE